MQYFVGGGTHARWGTWAPGSQRRVTGSSVCVSLAADDVVSDTMGSRLMPEMWEVLGDPASINQSILFFNVA